MEIFTIVILTLCLVFAICFYLIERAFGRAMDKIAREALDGWAKAIKSHLEDRETFVGRQFQKNEWPDEINKG